MDISQIKNIDINTYLQRNGYHGTPSGKRVFYISPFRKESSPSFAVSHQGKRWIDFSDLHNLQGDIIDLVSKLHNVDFQEACDILMRDIGIPESPLSTKKSLPSSLTLSSVSYLQDPDLITYVLSRRISVFYALKYLSEGNISIKKKSFKSLLYKNDMGGYDVRTIKGNKKSLTIAPKWVTTHKFGSEKLCIFEGMFDMLSYMELYGRDADVLCLNGVGNIKARRGEEYAHEDFLKQYKQVEMWVDNDKAGDGVLEFLDEIDVSYVDKRYVYGECNDLNEWLIKKL